MSQRGFVGELATGKNIKGQKASNRAINKKATLTLYLYAIQMVTARSFYTNSGK